MKVRVVHHVRSGPQLNDGVRWNEFAVAMPAPTPETIRAVRVRPELARWSYQAEYFHTEQHTEMQTRYRSEQYACGTQTTGYGTSRTTSTRYCTRQVPYQELVTVTRHVSDGSCRTGVSHAPRVSAAYLIQFDYFGPGQCSATCMRQHPSTDGSFRFVACGEGEMFVPEGVSAGGEVVVPPAPGSRFSDDVAPTDS